MTVTFVTRAFLTNNNRFEITIIIYICFIYIPKDNAYVCGPVFQAKFWGFVKPRYQLKGLGFFLGVECADTGVPRGVQGRVHGERYYSLHYGRYELVREAAKKVFF